MKVGVLGVGRMGSRHAALLRGVPGVSSVAVSDVDEGRTRAVADALGVTPHEPSALLDAVDALVVAAGPDGHAAAVRAALERRLPTLCEKPLAADLPATLAVAAEVERSGVPVQIGFQRRFDPAYAEARRLLETGALGDVFLVRLAALDPVAAWGGVNADTFGLFRDSSIHDFDLARWLTASEVVEVHAMGALRGGAVATHEDPDLAAVTMRTASGAVCVLTGLRLNPRGYDIRTEVLGTRDSVSIGLSERTPQRNLEPGAPAPRADAWQHYLDRFEAAYRLELEAFVAVAAGSRLPSPGVADATAAMRIAVAATRSLRERRVVSLGEIPGAPEASPDAH